MRTVKEGGKEVRLYELDEVSPLIALAEDVADLVLKARAGERAKVYVLDEMDELTRANGPQGPRAYRSREDAQRAADKLGQRHSVLELDLM